MPLRTLLVLLCIFPFFFVGGTDETSSRTITELWNCGHLIFFSVFTLFLFTLPHGKRDWGKTAWQSFILSAVIGGSIEILQQLFTSNRVVSFSDFTMDITGNLLTLIALQMYRDFRYRWLLLFSILFITALTPLLGAIMSDYQMYREFPVLSSGTEPSELKRWTTPKRMHIVNEPTIASHPVIQAFLPPTLYSGLSLKYFPRDWHKYKELIFSIYTTRQETLHYRIHDKKHHNHPGYKNRFNRTITIKPGWNKIATSLSEIKNGPLDRQLDLTQVYGFEFFFINPEKVKKASSRTIYLGPVFLR